MFEIGDKVVYPMHGAGIIEGIEEKEILGEIHSYYILRMPINELKVMIPINKLEESGVRKILDRQVMDEVFEILSSEEKVKMPENWNKRYRHNLDKIKSGDILEIASVVKALQKLDVKKSLSTGERKILSEARQIIVSEMALVYQKDIDEISNMVDRAIMD